MPAVALATSDPASSGISRSVPTLRILLKEATSEAHTQLDAQFGSFEMSGAPGYRRFLEASAAALLPLEAALEAAGVTAEFADWPQRARRSAIMSDLAKVGGALPAMSAVAPLNRNTLFGVMYVLEGSRLGAKYMMRGMTASAYPVITGATAYLAHGAGEHLWQSFLARLESHPPENEAEAIEGARMAFAIFAQAAARA